MFHEASKRQPSGRFVVSSQLKETEHIGKHLVARLPQCKTCLGPRLVKEMTDGECDGASVPTLVKLSEDSEVEGDVRIGRIRARELVGELLEGVESAIS